MKTKHYRQGDVLIMRVPKIHKNKPMEREGGKVILAHGEVTGHAHAISDTHAEQSRGHSGCRRTNTHP